MNLKEIPWFSSQIILSLKLEEEEEEEKVHARIKLKHRFLKYFWSLLLMYVTFNQCTPVIHGAPRILEP